MEAKRDYMTVTELAAAAGLSTARIRQILAGGRGLRGEKLFGNWIIRKAEAERWLAERRAG